MSTIYHHDGRVEAFFGDDEYAFRLDVKRIQDLEVKLGGLGIYELSRRFAEVRVTSTQVRWTLFFGLVGADMKASEAHRLVERYFVPPLLDAYKIALEVVEAAVMPPPGEPTPPGKAQAEADPASTPPPSTEPAAP